MGRSNNSLLTIKQVHEVYDATVWDNCALNGYLLGNGKGTVKDCSEFAEFFIDKVSIYPCFIPKSVKEEYTYGMNHNSLKRTKKGKFIKKFELEERILCMGDLPIGPRVRQISKKLNADNGINKVDWRVYAWTKGLSDFFDSSAIVSNDIRGLAKLWKSFVHKRIINPKELGFVVRRGLDSYEWFV